MHPPKEDTMPLPTFHMIDAAPTPVATFSHASEVDGWVFLTGQMPTWPGEPERALPEGVEAQTRRVMDNLGLVLQGMGLELKNVVQARVYLTHFDRDYAQMNATYKSYFEDGKLPARTCIGVSGLAVGALVEIDLVARRP
ncbi:RidA family protein [Roseinatronobacter thiooxidans]|nr:RidA family protein [Roseinatronobacter thiooxidans]